jgi:hypothetical protein
MLPKWNQFRVNSASPASTWVFERRNDPKDRAESASGAHGDAPEHGAGVIVTTVNFTDGNAAERAALRRRGFEPETKYPPRIRLAIWTGMFAAGALFWIGVARLLFGF